jgi:uroporphyrinogen-III synthase
MTETGFGGRRVVTFESRRAAEMASLIARHGGVPVSAPTLREVALADNPAALAFARSLGAGAFDVVVLMTGTGTRALVEEIASELDRAAFAAALGRVPLLVARGPKPAAVLRELGVVGFLTVPEPNTWREVARALEASGPLAGRRVAVQEHGAPSQELYDLLTHAGAEVTPVQVYRWALPEDTTPLRRALHEIAEGPPGVALFTSRAQVEHAFAIAAEEGIEAAVRERLRAGVVASIGPVCTVALRAEGLTPDFEPEHPRMGHLVKTAAERAASILATKAPG